MPDPVGLYLQDRHALGDALKYVRYAETRGFDVVWQAETRLARDAPVTLAAYAATTTRIRLAAGALNIWACNAAMIAAKLLTLDDLAPERIIAGLGTWWEPLASRVGIQRRKNLLAMREVSDALRRLLSGQHITLNGEFVNLNDVGLDVHFGRREPRRVPIYIAATGPKLMALAGEIADGVLLNYLVVPDYTTAAADHIAVGAHKAGRSPDSVARHQLIVCSTDRDRDKALDRGRQFLVPYMREHPTLMRANGVDQDLIDRVIQSLRSNDNVGQAATLIPDDVVQQVMAAGTPDECRAKVMEYTAAGATHPILYALGDDVRHMIDVFAYGYTGS